VREYKAGAHQKTYFFVFFSPFSCQKMVAPLMMEFSFLPREQKTKSENILTNSW
jgi:hypothetical protein